MSIHCAAMTTDHMDTSCFYHQSPMMATVKVFSVAMQQNVRVFVGAYVVLDVYPFLGGYIKPLPYPRASELQPLATTGKLWRAIIGGLNFHLRDIMSSALPSPLLSSLRTSLISQHIDHPQFATSDDRRWDEASIRRFESSLPFEVQSYARPTNMPHARCVSACCTGDLFVHPFPALYHEELHRRHGLWVRRHTRVTSLARQHAVIMRARQHTTSMTATTKSGGSQRPHLPNASAPSASSAPSAPSKAPMVRAALPKFPKWAVPHPPKGPPPAHLIAERDESPVTDPEMPALELLPVVTGPSPSAPRSRSPGSPKAMPLRRLGRLDQCPPPPPSPASSSAGSSQTSLQTGSKSAPPRPKPRGSVGRMDQVPPPPPPPPPGSFLKFLER